MKIHTKIYTNKSIFFVRLCCLAVLVVVITRADIIVTLFTRNSTISNLYIDRVFLICFKGSNLKWLSLIVLVIQNASTIILLRYVRTAPGDMFFSTTAIVCQEFIKMIVATLCIYAESKDFG